LQDVVENDLPVVGFQAQGALIIDRISGIAAIAGIDVVFAQLFAAATAGVNSVLPL
jgi:hypothetical protein